MQPVYKPGSVFSIQKMENVCHLSENDITTALIATYPSASGEPPYISDIHGLATHNAYGASHCCDTR